MKYVGRTLVFLTAIVLVFPLIWMAKTSFESFNASVLIPPTLIPRDPSLFAYREIFLEPIALWFWNSTLICGVATGITIMFTMAAGYGFEKHNWEFKEVVFWTMLCTVIIPAQTTLIPVYLMIRRFGLYDTRLGVIIPALASPFFVFFYRMYLRRMPNDFIEAARIDGAGTFRELWHVVGPMTAPAITTMAILTFLGNWKNYFWQLVILQTESKQTVVAGIADAIYKIMMSSQNKTYDADFGEFARGYHYSSMCAGAMVSFVPLFFLFILMQRKFIRSLYAGGLDG